MPAAHEQVRLANVALVTRFIEAINDSWNVDAMRELISDDFFFPIPFAPIGSRSATRARRKRSSS